jgi:invasion protein IalB
MICRRLFAAEPPRMCPAMFPRPGFLSLIPVVLGLLGAPALVHLARAQTPPPAAKAGAAKAIGKFEDWTAATNKEAGQTVCYAFTYALASKPAISGRDRVVLTVTERTGGRDAVAISAGFSYATNATVSVVIDAQPPLDFYTSQRSAFSRDGHATVQGFLKGLRVVATSPGPKNVQVADTFSLKGFNAAYAAIVKACPAGKGEK